MRLMDGIEIYVKVIQQGSLSAASRAMGIPVTTISAKVASLERRLGVTLIQRTTRRLNVTEAGKLFYEHCLKGLDEIEAGVLELTSSKKEPQGLLRITASPAIGHIVLPPLINEYMDKYPKVKVQLILTNRKVDLVQEGIDLAIRAGELEDSTLIARKLNDVKWKLYSSPQYIKKHGVPSSPGEIAKHAYISFSVLDRGAELNLSDGAEKTKVKISPKIMVDDIEAARIFVETGRGIAFLPSLMVEREVKKGVIVPILNSWTLSLDRNTVAIVYPNQRFVPPKIKAFVELFLDRKFQV